jgi:hypothetical protein
MTVIGIDIHEMNMIAARVRKQGCLYGICVDDR